MSNRINIPARFERNVRSLRAGDFASDGGYVQSSKVECTNDGDELICLEIYYSAARIQAENNLHVTRAEPQTQVTKDTVPPIGGRIKRRLKL